VKSHSLLDECLQQLRELLGVMCTIDNGGPGGLVKVSLSTQLAPVELQDVCRHAHAEETPRNMSLQNLEMRLSHHRLGMGT